MIGMNKKQIESLTLIELVAEFNRFTVKATKEANTVRGESKKTQRELELFIKEISNRLNIDNGELLKMIRNQ